MIKRFENFSGKIKLDTQEVIDLISILFKLKPTLPDDFPTKSLSQLASNIVTYKSDDDNFNIAVNFQENDMYVDKSGNLVNGKYRTIFKIKITKNDTNLLISDVRDYINFTTNIVEESYDDVSVRILFDGEKYKLEEFDKMKDRNINDILFIIRIK